LALLILLAFIAVPIAEIAVFIQAGDLIGLWPTIALVILTAIIGTAMLRQQGLATLGRLRSTMDRGELPVRELFDGACLLLAGALLLTPGFLTDAVGFLLLVPPVRAIVGAAIWQRMQRSGNFSVHVGGVHGGAQGGHRPTGGGAGGGPVVDAEYEVVEPEPGELPPRDGDDGKGDRR
jgi:UPF0716 protein FxsA